MRRLGFPLYPVAFAAMLLFQLVATSGVGVWVSFRPLVIAVVVAVILTAAIRLLLGDAQRTGPPAALAILGIMLGDGRVLALAAVVLAIFVVERRLLPGRLQLPWPAIHAAGRALVLIASIAILIQAQQVGAFEVLARSATHEGPLKPTRSFGAVDEPARPDIYVLLLDGYARSDALRQVFGLDDRPFLDGLVARGLAVSSHARTNYPITVQVVMSMFHMKLLSDIPALRPLLADTYAGTEIGLTHAVVQENPLFDALHAHDYEIVGVASGFAQLSLREADEFITSGNVNEFEVAVLRRTSMGDIVDAVGPDFISSQYRDRITSTWRTLGDLAAEQPGHPRFVFAHLPTPHPPWVFNADGSPRTSPNVHAIYEEMPGTTGLSVGDLKTAYRGSVQALWRPILDTIDAIDRASATPPVIVVFGDHGSWIGALPGDDRLRFLPLLAARVPGLERPLPDDESLVNVFPDLLNPLIGTSFSRVDPAPSFMFGSRGEYDLHPLADPNAAISTP